MSEADQAGPNPFHLPDDPTPIDEAVYIPSVTPSHARNVYDAIHNTKWTRPLPAKVSARQLNFLDPENDLFRISHVMYSAGQALNVNSGCIVTERDKKRTRLICDSGGYQIATGQLHINGDAHRLRILQWQERHADARASLGQYLDFYNRRRPHSSAGGRTPEQAYLDHMPRQMAE